MPLRAEGEDGAAVGNVANLVQAEDDVAAEGPAAEADNVV